MSISPIAPFEFLAINLKGNEFYAKKWTQVFMGISDLMSYFYAKVFFAKKTWFLAVGEHVITLPVRTWDATVVGIIPPNVRTCLLQRKKIHYNSKSKVPFIIFPGLPPPFLPSHMVIFILGSFLNSDLFPFHQKRLILVMTTQRFKCPSCLVRVEINFTKGQLVGFEEPRASAIICNLFSRLQKSIDVWQA